MHFPVILMIRSSAILIFVTLYLCVFVFNFVAISKNPKVASVFSVVLYSHQRHVSSYQAHLQHKIQQGQRKHKRIYDIEDAS